MDYETLESMPGNVDIEGAGGGNYIVPPGGAGIQELWGQAEQNAYERIYGNLPSTGTGSQSPGIPTRRDGQLHDSAQVSMYRNPDGSLTNLPVSPNATLIAGPGTSGFTGPGGGGTMVQGNIPGIIKDAGGGNRGMVMNSVYGGESKSETMGYNPLDRMPFSPTWNIADSLEMREKRMNSTKDVFDRMHEYRSPAATYSSDGSLPGMGGGIPGRKSSTGTGGGGQITTQMNIMPAAPMPTFTRPVVDQAKIESRIQEIMAPATSALKRSIREAMARRRFGSPTMDRYAMGGAMEGYGRALSDVQSKARQAGRAEYMSQDYQPQWQEAMTNYNAQLQNWMNQIQRQTVTESIPAA